MESSGSYQDNNQTFGFDSRSAYSGRLHLDLKELCSKRDKPDYDEIDLVSECSTPGAYVPGKFLQLCDFPSDTNNDALIWPVSLGGTIRSDADTQQLMHNQPRHVDEESFSFRQVTRKTQRISLQNPKFFVPLVVCVIIALFALGGLAAFV